MSVLRYHKLAQMYYIKSRHAMRLAVILIACLLPVVAVADDDAAGKSLYTTCQACHGAKAEGNIGMNAPSLTWHSSYLKRQLHNFKAGVRGSDPRDSGGSQMRAMAATLTNETAIDNVVAYIESLPNTKTVATLKGNTANGRDYYSMVCGGCHGPKAEGNSALNAPALAASRCQCVNVGDDIAHGLLVWQRTRQPRR